MCLALGDIRLEVGCYSLTLHPALRPLGAAASIGAIININIFAMIIIIPINAISIITILIVLINILVTTLALSPLGRAMSREWHQQGFSLLGNNKLGIFIFFYTAICVFHFGFSFLNLCAKLLMGSPIPIPLIRSD